MSHTNRNGIMTLIREIILNIFNILGLNKAFGLLQKDKLTILMYHNICDDNSSLAHKTDIPKSIFLKQVNYLLKKNYYPINLTDWIKISKLKKPTNKKFLILTFDDGFRNVLRNALPIMERLGLKGCIYLVSSLIDTNNILWTDKIYFIIKNLQKTELNLKFQDRILKYKVDNLSSKKLVANEIKNKLRRCQNFERIGLLKQLESLNRLKSLHIPEDYKILNRKEAIKISKLLEIGSHSKSHPNLAYLKNDELEEELSDSKLEIERKIGSRVINFCYPAGSYNEIVIELAKRYGYKTGVTVEEGFNSKSSDLFRLKRIKADKDLLLFKFKISGAYYFLRKWIKIPF